MNSIMLTVVEKFCFSDGSTVFSVIPLNSRERIPAGLFKLMINEENLAEIWIDGEHMLENQGKSPYRAVSTKDSAKMKGLLFESEKWQLVSQFD